MHSVKPMTLSTLMAAVMVVAPTWVEAQQTSVSNVALDKPASQSSTFEKSDAGRAVDGNTDGNYFNGSVSSTPKSAGAWWKVNLVTPHDVEYIKIWNRTDAVKERLRDFVVEYLDKNGAVITSERHGGTVEGSVTIRKSVAEVYQVKVRFHNRSDWLTLAEVEVFGRPFVGRNVAPALVDRNVALGKPASQGPFYGELFNASRAVDGDTNGMFMVGSTSSTNARSEAKGDEPKEAWWKVNLGAAHQINKVTIWNREDCCTQRLSNFDLDYLDASGNVLASHAFNGSVDRAADINLSVSGVHEIRIRLREDGRAEGEYYLSLAEVEVFGSPQSFPNVALGKPTTQSTTSDLRPLLGINDLALSSYAVDGNTNIDGQGELRSKTKPEKKPWWIVDLGKAHDIYKVVLWNSFGYFTEYSDLINFNVDYLDQNETVIATKTHPSRAGRWTQIDLSGKGVYKVRVQLNGGNPNRINTVLSLAEVQVFGIPSAAARR